MGELLNEIGKGEVQLPDFQRDWKWDDDHIKSLLATVSLGYPIGVVMTLETGNDAVRFKPKPLSGVDGDVVEPEQLLLDGQQRLTSLFRSLKADTPVDTFDARKQRLRRWYYIDIEKSLGDEADRDDAIVSVPEDKVLRSDFGRRVDADYSTQELECAAGMFPLSRALEGGSVTKWIFEYVKTDGARQKIWERFQDEVLAKIQGYMVPVIKLTNDTPKEAVSSVFEKVNTGGVPLNVFELMTATFAGEQWYYDEHGDDFRLSDDWKRINKSLKPHNVLQAFENTDFLQAVTLVATYERRREHIDAGKSTETAPGVSCKRRDILRLTLREYLDIAPRMEQALLWAASFLNGERIFRAQDLPYRTQLVPLAAIRAMVGRETDIYSNAAKLQRWYWSGVLGEMYGGSVETRFARDLEGVIEWLKEESGSEPQTVADATFHEQRLLTMRTRNSAAYKGTYALLMREGCQDWMHKQHLDLASFFNHNVDIHHIFPKKWCQDQGVAPDRRESIVNKTALSAYTNRMIGSRSPKEYVEKVSQAAGLASDAMDDLLRSHYIDPSALRAADFDAFFAARSATMLELIDRAMGKPATRIVQEPGTDQPESFEPEEADADDADE
ncbi:GmrSD restriction endonuclease domain-containing protein [Haloactinomyces albus]|uniref:GmrSD restriction endonucleases N-terminal domain-containing protein n=1 Tax=Haloactinomyces albus TaxID=1352928 RepID=A0AAE3ZIH0_9ACTN|nr:DUF262 domain-containing protein [Haloactinomyces albus]MDR7304208.1 hypothetical protein [Haloactinomyces albus]